MSLRSQQSPLNSRVNNNPPPPPSDSGYSGVSAYAKSSSATTSNTIPINQNQNGSGYINNSSGNSGSTGGGTTAKPPPLTLEQSRATARTHFLALRGWLARENVLTSSATSRNTARDKLTRLTRQQFQELSTDVYDELMRRVEDAAGRPGDQPFLSVRSEFHPKRNQARQKLATLPLQRFRDLASDVYFELERRYPEFVEQPDRDDEEEEDQAQPIERAPSPSTYSPPATRPNQPSSSTPPPRQQIPAPKSPPNSSPATNRRIPTPINNNSSSSNVGVSNDVVVPNKSTMVMEESAPLNGSGGDYRRPDSSASRRSDSNYGGGQPQGAIFGQPRGLGPTRPQSSNSVREKEREDQYEDIRTSSGNQQQGGRGSNTNQPSRASETSSIGTRFIGNYIGSAPASEVGGRRSGHDEQWEYEEKQKLTSEYEYKITMLQNRISDLQRENEDVREALKAREGDSARLGDLESQLRSQRERYEEQSSQLQRLQTDHTSLQSQYSRSMSDSSNVARLGSELDRLTRERVDQDELQTEVGSLVDELRDVNSKYEELLDEREKEVSEKKELEEEAKAWRRKYEQAKTELRSVKATSQMYSAAIRADGDYMPASMDGLIADVNVTAFQTSIDDLLQAARAKETSSVLSAMRAVVSAVDKIDHDVQAVDNRRILALPLSDQERLQSIKANTNATLSNLMTASKNHATSFGVSPVSLVDAAASHLSTAVIDLVRILRIKRTTGSSGSGSMSKQLPGAGGGGRTNGYTPSGALQSPVPESSRPFLPARTSSNNQRSQPQQDQYRGPTSPGYDSSPASPPYNQDRYSGNQSQLYDQSNRYGDSSPGYSGGNNNNYGAPNSQIQEEEEEDDDDPGRSYDELKNYLEHQTEAIVHSIQSLLSAIRSGAQAEQLNENLTRIITIVSSIVAISKDALPDGSEVEGREILQDLIENCDKLSGMSQSSQSAVFDKQTKQAMASASFGVAKSLKALNALLDNHQPR